MVNGPSCAMSPLTRCCPLSARCSSSSGCLPWTSYLAWTPRIPHRQETPSHNKVDTKYVDVHSGSYGRMWSQGKQPTSLARPCDNLGPRCVQGYEGSDLAYKSVLHSHVFLHWLVLLTACMTVGESDMHPLTMLGEAPAPQKAQHWTSRMLPFQADNSTHTSARTGWITAAGFHALVHLPKTGTDYMRGVYQNGQDLQASQNQRRNE